MVGAGGSAVAVSGLTTGIVTGVSAARDANAANLSLLGAGVFWDGSDMMDSFLDVGRSSHWIVVQYSE